MSPHQLGRKIALNYLESDSEFVNRLADDIALAIQSARNEEWTRRREYIAALEAALEVARHGLCASNGLTAYDGATEASRALAQHFKLDNSAELDAIDAAISGGTSALDAVVAETVAKVTAERDGLAAALATVRKRAKAMDEADQAGVLDCEGGIVPSLFDGVDDCESAILAACDLRMKAEGRREGLLQAAAHAEESEILIPAQELNPAGTKREHAGVVIKYLAIELRKLAAQAGEVGNG